MPDRPTLAVCMIAMNEGKRLPAAIASITKIADRVIVVDTGSTDDTIEVARSLGAEVVEHAWQDDFAEARNRSLAEAESDWIRTSALSRKANPLCVKPYRVGPAPIW